MSVAPPVSPDFPVLLALDSATEILALALVQGESMVALQTEGGARASAVVIPELMGLLAAQNLLLAQVDAVAFGCGPGAFTGLRTACAVAQGLAFGADKPVLAIDSLMLVAEDAQGQAGGTLGEVWVAMDARMGEIYAARYASLGDARWQVLDAPALYKPEALRSHWGQPQAVAGSALIELAAGLGELPAAVYPQCQSRAAALGRLARAAWLHGERLDAAQALPVYVRDKVALTTEERRRGAA